LVGVVGHFVLGKDGWTRSVGFSEREKERGKREGVMSRPEPCIEIKLTAITVLCNYSAVSLPALLPSVRIVRPLLET
jgi:hypothetical protein